MPFTGHFRIATDKEKTEAVARLVKASTGDFDFYMFTVFGIAIALLGLVLDSPEMIIGGMLIAPVLYPLLSLSLSVVLSDRDLMERSLRTLVIAFGSSVVVAFALSFLIGPWVDIHLNDQVLERAQPNMLYFIIAFISSFAATYALVHDDLSELLPGVVISVSLSPPLAVFGFGVATFNGVVASGALMLFVVNSIGAALASMLVFTLMDLHNTRKVADSAIRQEERRIEHELDEIHDMQTHDHA